MSTFDFSVPTLLHVGGQWREASDAATIPVFDDGIEAGMVAVNHMSIATAEAPFGGVKKSGFGREGGSEGILDYTHAKFVSVAL